MPLHGLADNRTSFLRSATVPTRRYRVVLPDLPGHGTDAAVPGLDYSISGHIQALLGHLQPRRGELRGRLPLHRRWSAE
ncbi:alpha/beta fold hydrolase [Streptomyces mirabilis]|uniref:alpha/beta fold hydrolase n=1 Tax=Streptomyces mirabilis TaxID=68239 RepID=UPI0036A765D2